MVAWIHPDPIVIIQHHRSGALRPVTKYRLEGVIPLVFGPSLVGEFYPTEKMGDSAKRL